MKGESKFVFFLSPIKTRFIYGDHCCYRSRVIHVETDMET